MRQDDEMTHGCFCPRLLPAVARRETTAFKKEKKASWTAQEEQVGRVELKEL